MIEVPASGIVPREIVLGIVWGEFEEKCYASTYRACLTGAYVMTSEEAERSARDFVLLALHRRWIGDRMREAQGCRDNQAKRDIYQGWCNQYGELKAQELAEKAKNESFVKAAVKWL